MKNEIAIYQGKDGAIEFSADVGNDTVWATQAQIAKLFGVTPQNITLHLKSIYDIEELIENRTCKEILQVRTEGKREIRRNVKVYNLDAILSVGYRVNSKSATDFRIWANSVLRDYLLKGAAVNRKRLRELNQVLEIVSRSEISEVAGVAELLKHYSSALNLLAEYDEGKIAVAKGKKPRWTLTYEEARQFLNELANGKTDNFARERNDSFRGILAALYQTFDGQELYATTEEKAANLLYLVVKDHAFVDGNKRSAAALFVQFLNRNRMLRHVNGDLRIANNTLAAMTLMVALSRPNEKEIMIKLVMNLLEGEK